MTQISFWTFSWIGNRLSRFLTESYGFFATGAIEGYTTASCITDVFYFVRKHLHDTERSYDAMENLLGILQVCEVSDRHIREALRLRRPDFEDALVAACAKSVLCDYIVTRDTKGFTDFEIPSLTPEELLQKVT